MHTVTCYNSTHTLLCPFPGQCFQAGWRSWHGAGYCLGVDDLSPVWLGSNSLDGLENNVPLGQVTDGTLTSMVMTGSF